MREFFGPSMVMVFCLSQAFRDVYFAAIFQALDFFAVIAVAFGLSTIIFGSLTVLRSPGEFAALRRHWRIVAMMNATTALAWICYFFGLEHLEPSIVNTVHSGMAPLTVIVMAAAGAGTAKQPRITRREYVCYTGLALTLVALWWVVLSGRSGLAGSDGGSSLLSLSLLLVSGSSITVSLLYSKHLHDEGLSAESITAVRYLMIIALAVAIELFKGWPDSIGRPSPLASIAVATTLLIALPTFALQLGVARTAPLTAQVIRALGPVCVFGLEQYDHRLSYAAPTLACIIAYSLFTIMANFAHGWRDSPHPRQEKSVMAATSSVKPRM